MRENSTTIRNPVKNPSKDNISPEEKAVVMKNIETKAEAQVRALPLGQAVQQSHSIMQAGADEFYAKFGRNMTYSEIRQLYG